jgi:hypothetical protein
MIVKSCKNGRCSAAVWHYFRRGNVRRRLSGGVTNTKCTPAQRRFLLLRECWLSFADCTSMSQSFRFAPGVDSIPPELTGKPEVTLKSFHEKAGMSQVCFSVFSLFLPVL